MGRNCLCILVAVILVLICACKNSSKEVGNDNPADKSVAASDSVVIVLEGQEGRSIFEITAQKYDLGYEESYVGMFVYRIDSLETSVECGWVYSVNDTMATVASDRYLTKEGDIVRWHYRKY
jgi:hypothetical protein